MDEQPPFLFCTLLHVFIETVALRDKPNMSITPNDVLVGLNQTQPTLNALQEVSNALAMGRTFSKRLDRTIVAPKAPGAKCFNL